MFWLGTLVAAGEAQQEPISGASAPLHAVHHFRHFHQDSQTLTANLSDLLGPTSPNHQTFVW
jgi:hypothetical protein